MKGVSLLEDKQNCGLRAVQAMTRHYLVTSIVWEAPSFPVAR